MEGLMCFLGVVCFFSNVCKVWLVCDYLGYWKERYGESYCWVLIRVVCVVGEYVCSVGEWYVLECVCNWKCDD